jgi:hypothetical protein
VNAVLCPDVELPPDGDPVTGSIAVVTGAYPGCPLYGRLVPIVFSLADGATGLRLPDLPPLNASTNGLEYSISPDSSLLAISATPVVHVIDLRTWSQLAAVEFPDGVPLDPQVWSPDGSKLYLRLGWSGRTRTGPSVHSDRRIWQFDVATRTLTHLPDLPFDSMLHPQISDDGRLLYALAFDREDRDYLWAVKGEPFLSVVELATGRELTRIPLPGLKVGTDEEYVTHRPAAVLDDAARRYYLAHADSDKVTVIELASGNVATTSISAKGGKSLPARLLDGLESLFFSKAEAKGNGFYRRQASLSSDGRLLLVTGMDEVHDEDARATPAGLRIIDTATLEVLHREEGVSRFILTEDGRYALGIGHASYFERRWTPEGGYGLKVLDLETMQLAAHVESGRTYTSMALTLDGRHLHLTAYDPTWAQMRQRGLKACIDPCTTEVVLDVIDVETWTLVSRQPLEAPYRAISRWREW